MSDSIFRIWSIALYEAKVIMRGWTFRIAVLLNLAALITAYLMRSLAMKGAPLFYPGNSDIPSSFPYITLLYSNIIISVAGGLIAADSIYRDRSLDSNDAVFSRDFCILEYLAGKIGGLSLAFLIHTVSVLAVTYIYNIVFSGADVSYTAYVVYPLLICLPSFVFFAGSSSFFQSVLGNKALTFIVTLGVMAFFIVLAADKFFYAFDAAAFRIPLLLSEYTGLAKPFLTIAQRSAFLLAGIGMYLSAYRALKRPKQSKLVSSAMTVSVPLMAAASILLIIGFIRYHTDGISMRAEMMETVRGYRSEPMVTPFSFDIDLAHNGSELDIRTQVVLQNNTDDAIERYLFNLNPGLDVISVMSDGRDLQFVRTMQVIDIHPEEELMPGATDTITVVCRGSIEDSACFPDADESIRWRGYIFYEDFERIHRFELNFKYSRFHFRRQYSFVTDDYLLLLPHAMWYPAPGLVRGSQDPGLENMFFAEHKLKITVKEDLRAVSQGTATRDAGGVFEFVPDDPLPGATLAAGKYNSRSTYADSIEYSLWTLCPDDYFMDYYREHTDTIPALIKELQEYVDSRVGLDYPFGRFVIVETPLNFRCFARPLVTNGREYCQPGLVLAPERGESWATDYLHEFNYHWGGRYDSGESPRIKASGNFFYSIWYSLIESAMFFPINNYYSGAFHLGSGRGNALNHAVESHFAERLIYGIDIDSSFRPGTGRLARTIFALDGTDLPTLLGDRSRYDAALSALPLKGKQLIIELQGMVGEIELERYLADLMARNRFRVLPVEGFYDDFENHFGIDAGPVVERWYYSKELPGFIIEDVEWYSLIDDGFTRYQFRMKAYNREKVPGMIRLSFPPLKKTGEKRINHQAVECVRTFLFEPGEALEIGIVNTYKIKYVVVNTLISKNLPPVKQYHTRKFVQRDNVRPFDGTRVIDSSRFDQLETVHIVDNADPGFEVISDPGKSPLKRIFNRSEYPDVSSRYVRFRRNNLPLVWKESIHSMFYGPYVQSAHYIAAGTGEGRVRWTVDIPESGTYEVHCFMPDCRDDIKKTDVRKKLTVQEYHFSVEHDEGTDHPVVLLLDCRNGWNLIGTYYFSRGKASVELIDESPKWSIIADAVKWVKKD